MNPSDAKGQHVIILGLHRAATRYARTHGLQPHQWTSAYDPASAMRALLGRHPGTTKVVHVTGSERVWTPEVENRFRILEALRGHQTGGSM
jgi:D-alanyl-D-alanine carboxypeptidase